VPRQVIDPGPFRYTEIHSRSRPPEERIEVTKILRMNGGAPASATFRLEEIPVIELIESVIVGAHLDRGLSQSGLFDYDAWRAAGSPEAPLRNVLATIDHARRIDTPQFTPRLTELEALYARGGSVDPLIAKERDYKLSSGDNALKLLDGHKRSFAVARTDVDRVPV
jgi:hypothetical protein